jgi:hypothetical protein
MSMQASTPEMLSFMTSSLELSPRLGKAESKIFMDMPKRMLDKALNRNCTKVNVEIIFPRQLSEFHTIEIESSHKGNVRIRMDEIYLTNKLWVRTKVGNVNIKDTVVENELNVQAKGKLEANVAVKSLVKLEASGDINLDLASLSSSLDVNANAGGKAIVFLVRKAAIKSCLKNGFVFFVLRFSKTHSPIFLFLDPTVLWSFPVEDYLVLFRPPSLKRPTLLHVSDQVRQLHVGRICIEMARRARVPS